MKKIKLLFGFFICFTMVPQTGLASGSGNAQMTQMLNIATAGAAGAYSAANFAACPPHNYPACIQGIMGILQMIQSLMGAANSGQTGADLLNGDYGGFTFDPGANGFCFDASTGCTPDAIDGQLTGLDTAFRTGEGYDDALAKLKNDAANKIKEMEKKGFKIDSAKGLITDPSGKTTTFAAAAANVPKNFGDAANAKFAGVIDQIKEQDKKRGLASEGGAAGSGGAGGIAFKDEYYGGGDGFGSGKGKKGKSDKDKKKSLLASLTDKDAKKGAIGIAGDNIFGMVNRRYIKKTKSAEFIKK